MMVLTVRRHILFFPAGGFVVTVSLALLLCGVCGTCLGGSLSLLPKEKLRFEGPEENGEVWV